MLVVGVGRGAEVIVEYFGDDRNAVFLVFFVFPRDFLLDVGLFSKGFEFVLRRILLVQCAVFDFVEKVKSMVVFVDVCTVEMVMTNSVAF